MGYYFITNAKNVLGDLFSQLDETGMHRREVRESGSFSVVSCAKKNVRGSRNVYERDGDYIIGFGAYSYDGVFGERALKRIFEDFEKDMTPFSDVLGHFNFVISLKGQLLLVTDKTGILHSYVCHEKNTVLISSSFSSIANCAKRLTVNQQAVLEFVNMQTIFGGASLFEEIVHVPEGTVYNVATQEHRRYYDRSDVGVDLETLVERLSAYFESYRKIDYTISADLSGGYDTRTVAAIIEANGLPIPYNTNINVADFQDHLIANEIAVMCNKAITTFTMEFHFDQFLELVEETFAHIELGRDIFSGAFTSMIFEMKSAAFDIVLGGYGGELYREVHSAPLALSDLVEHHFVAKRLNMDGAETTRYVDNLMSKFLKTLAELDEKDPKKSNEKLYFFEKMKYWGGARISAFNQYCYRVHPLLDHALAKYLFDIPFHEKVNAQFQKRLINRLCPEMANVRSLYLGRTLLPEDEKSNWERIAEKPTILKQKAEIGFYKLLRSNHIKRLGPSVTSAVERFLKYKKRMRRSVPNYLDIYAPSPMRVSDYISVKPSPALPNQLLGRLLTIEKALQTFLP